MSGVDPVIQGRVAKLGDNVNTDVIIPGRYLVHVDPEALGRHAFEVLGEDQQARLRQARILVAGTNLGCGSAREQAVTALQGLGLSAVVASSFARTFFRNAINRGFPIVECPELCAAAREGDEIRIDLAAGTILRDDERYRFGTLPDSIRRILELGGLVAYLRQRSSS